MITLEQAFLHPSGTGGFLTGLTPNGKTAFLAYWQFSDRQSTRYSLNSHEQLVISPSNEDPFSPVLALGTTLLLCYNASAEPFIAEYQNGGNFLSASCALPPHNHLVQTALLQLSDCSFSYSFFSAQYEQKDNSPQQCSQHFSQFSYPSYGKGQLLWNDQVLPDSIELPGTLTELGDTIWKALSPLHRHVALYTYELNCITAVTGIRILQTD